MAGKKLVFEDAKGKEYPQKPPLPKESPGSGGFITNIGSRIGVWKPA